MKVATLPPSGVASDLVCRYLMKRGHEITIGLFGHVPKAVAGMLKDGVDGVLILTDHNGNLNEIAACVTRATGRPLWLKSQASARETGR